jgi:hypothetical protein
MCLNFHVNFPLLQRLKTCNASSTTCLWTRDSAFGKIELDSMTIFTLSMYLPDTYALRSMPNVVLSIF